MGRIGQRGRPRCQVGGVPLRVKLGWKLDVRACPPFPDKQTWIGRSAQVGRPDRHELHWSRKTMLAVFGLAGFSHSQGRIGRSSGLSIAAYLEGFGTRAPLT